MLVRSARHCHRRGRRRERTDYRRLVRQHIRLALVPMSCKELEPKTMRVIRRREALRERWIAAQEAVALWIQILTEPGAQTPPAGRERADARDKIKWILLEGILGRAAHILGRLQLDNSLPVLIRHKVDTHPGDQFIRTIQQRRVRAGKVGLRIAVQDVAEVGMKAD